MAIEANRSRLQLPWGSALAKQDDVYCERRLHAWYHLPNAISCIAVISPCTPQWSTSVTDLRGRSQRFKTR